jgi:hypothetical protein
VKLFLCSPSSSSPRRPRRRSPAARAASWARDRRGSMLRRPARPSCAAGSRLPRDAQGAVVQGVLRKESERLEHLRQVRLLEEQGDVGGSGLERVETLRGTGRRRPEAGASADGPAERRDRTGLGQRRRAPGRVNGWSPRMCKGAVRTACKGTAKPVNFPGDYSAAGNTWKRIQTQGGTT